MKKTFIAPSVSAMDIQAERLLGGASTIQSGTSAQPGTESGGGVKGGNGGDGLAKGGVSTLSRMTTWAMGKMEF